MAVKLSVNINKVALIRNSRGGNLPNLQQIAIDCEKFGADGITVHPRPDQRHVRYDDLQTLKDVNTTEFNIEGYPNADFLNIVKLVKPHQCTLVPDPPGVLTSDDGWDIPNNTELLMKVISELQAEGVRVSLFMLPDEDLMEGASKVGADRVEFYTGEYARNYHIDKGLAVSSHQLAAKAATAYDLGVNAGHDLNLENLKYYCEQIPELMEVSIGHALISDALYYGLQNTIMMYRKLCNS
jgi:pyridoxine 5-phosphate synthase